MISNRPRRPEDRAVARLYFLRCRMRLRMRRFFRPTFRRPFPRRRLAIRTPGRFDPRDEGIRRFPNRARRFGKTAILLGAVGLLKRRIAVVGRIVESSLNKM